MFDSSPTKPLDIQKGIFERQAEKKELLKRFKEVETLERHENRSTWIKSKEKENA